VSDYSGLSTDIPGYATLLWLIECQKNLLAHLSAKCSQNSIKYAPVKTFEVT
jgi:hypothetical protein